MKKPFQFKKHYTLDEARALLPQVRQWLEQIDQARRHLELLEKRLEGLTETGHDLGGDSVNQKVKCLADLKSVLVEFATREILLKDAERGLIDFPAWREGREIFLCWEKDEEDIEHWHELDTGYAGRERL